MKMFFAKDNDFITNIIVLFLYPLYTNHAYVVEMISSQYTYGGLFNIV
jgi:hypothetical protein